MSIQSNMGKILGEIVHSSKLVSKLEKKTSSIDKKIKNFCKDIGVKTHESTVLGKAHKFTLQSVSPSHEEELPSVKALKHMDTTTKSTGQHLALNEHLQVTSLTSSQDWMKPSSAFVKEITGHVNAYNAARGNIIKELTSEIKQADEGFNKKEKRLSEEIKKDLESIKKDSREQFQSAENEIAKKYAPGGRRLKFPKLKSRKRALAQKKNKILLERDKKAAHLRSTYKKDLKKLTNKHKTAIIAAKSKAKESFSAEVKKLDKESKSTQKSEKAKVRELIKSAKTEVKKARGEVRSELEKILKQAKSLGKDTAKLLEKDPELLKNKKDLETARKHLKNTYDKLEKMNSAIDNAYKNAAKNVLGISIDEIEKTGLGEERSEGIKEIKSKLSQIDSKIKAIEERYVDNVAEGLKELETAFKDVKGSDLNDPKKLKACLKRLAPALKRYQKVLDAKNLAPKIGDKFQILLNKHAELFKDDSEMMQFLDKVKVACEGAGVKKKRSSSKFAKNYASVTEFLKARTDEKFAKEVVEYNDLITLIDRKIDELPSQAGRAGYKEAAQEVCELQEEALVQLSKISQNVSNGSERNKLADSLATSINSYKSAIKGDSGLDPAYLPKGEKFNTETLSEIKDVEKLFNTEEAFVEPLFDFFDSLPDKEQLHKLDSSNTIIKFASEMEKMLNNTNELFDNSSSLNKMARSILSFDFPNRISQFAKIMTLHNDVMNMKGNNEEIAALFAQKGKMGKIGDILVQRAEEYSTLIENLVNQYKVNNNDKNQLNTARLLGGMLTDIKQSTAIMKAKILNKAG